MTLETKSSNEIEIVTFPTFCWRIIAAHMIAYFIAATIAQIYYKPIWDSGTLPLIMKPMDSPLVALGPALQSINAFFMAIILFPIQSLIIGRKSGWLTLFLLVAGFSIFAPQAPAPGSFEGFIYTKVTLFEHLIGLPECFLYSLLFSMGFYLWYKKPKKTWNIVSIIAISLIALITTLGFLAAIGVIKQP